MSHLSDIQLYIVAWVFALSNTLTLRIPRVLELHQILGGGGGGGSGRPALYSITPLTFS